MRPPCCCLCDRTFDPGVDGDQLEFARRPSDEDFHERMARERFVDHPPNVEWFCASHLEAARARRHLTIDRALAELGHGTEGTA
jgi:hypothetical protein